MRLFYTSGVKTKKKLGRKINREACYFDTPELQKKNWELARGRRKGGISEEARGEGFAIPHPGDSTLSLPTKLEHGRIFVRTEF